jgi:AraC family transcriptional regulator of adaptative response/methylated-DNA-[protein]-cysteine methyltransferase
MYEASVRKDTSYEGIFFMAVKTTGIFCRPSCTARKPKFANVVFFKTVDEAMQHGFRACKVCKPLEISGAVPGFVTTAMNLVQKDTGVKLKDYDLKQLGIEPSKLRRWFRQNYSMTFQAYQRSFRINNAFRQMKQEHKTTDAAFSNGFESLSGFSDSFKKIIGTSPGKIDGKNVINITRITTPLGPMIAGATDEGICHFDFSERRMLETILKRIQRMLNATLVVADHPHFKVLNTQADEYFQGIRKEFDLPLHLVGTSFQKQVWEELLRIPYATTRSYKEQSIMLGNQKAIRAVAGANGENGIAIIVPCHRVIGENGHLTGYGGGLWRKKWLLDHEAKYAGLERQAKLFE